NAGALARGGLPLVPDVVDGDGLHVALLLRPFDDAGDVRVHAPATADKADVDAVVGPEDAALRCVGHGAERGLGRRRGGKRGGGGHGTGAHLSDEIAATGVFSHVWSGPFASAGSGNRDNISGSARRGCAAPRPVASSSARALRAVRARARTDRRGRPRGPEAPMNPDARHDAAARLVTAACVAMAAGVALGAFGAHGLSGHLASDLLATYETAVRYHLVHGLAALVAGIVARLGAPRAAVAGWMFLGGLVLFSGSLY